MTPRRHAGPLADVVDAVLEASVVGSFSRLGYDARSRLAHWRDVPDQRGRVLVVTGASSGIGRAAAVGLARSGASLWLIGRDPVRTAEVADEARAAARTGVGDGAEIEPVVLDVTDAAAGEAFVTRFMARHDTLHGLVHSAGALYSDYRHTPDGTELTVATAVLAPFRLTWLLAPVLRSAGDATIVTVSSGGMYTQRFDLDQLTVGPEGYRGTTAYARSKRAQVVLSHEWSHRWGADGVASYAMHPGWVDTPGLHSGLPGFTRLGPLLRDPAQGADTAVWLAAGGARHPGAGGTAQLEGFFLDRRRRSEYHLPWTRSSVGLAVEGARLWEWCADATGVGTDGP